MTKPIKKRVTVADLADAIDNREFAYMEMALIELEKRRSAQLAQHLRAALAHIGGYGDDPSFYFRRGLERTMEDDKAEYDRQVAERRKIYDDQKVKR